MLVKQSLLYWLAEEAMRSITSRYDESKIAEIDRGYTSNNYSITAYIRFNQEMLDFDDQQLVTRIHTGSEARDGYHYYQYFTPGTQLKFGSTFVC